MNKTVKERLNAFLRYKEVNNSEFGRAIGVSSAFVSSIRKSIQPDKIEKIKSTFPDLNVSWLLTGEGDMIESAEPMPTEQGGSIGDIESAHAIPLLPVSAQGGSLNDFIVSVKESDCEKVISPIKGADYAMSVAGDSMSPEYPSGSQILIKRINERAFIDWGKVYVLDTCNGTVIKQLFPSKKAGMVICKSINPKFPPFEVSMTDVYGVYRVLMCMSVK